MIRRLAAADLEVFRALRLEALQAEPANFASRYEDWVAQSDAEWLRRLTANAVFASFDGAEAVGMMGLTPQGGVKMAHRAHVGLVYLRRAYRGQGRAEAMLAAVEARARGMGVWQLELTVAAQNPVALRFYERMGFARVGLIPAGFLHEGRAMDDVLMMKRIGAALVSG